jgi:alcohol dehydrogenase class IV
VYDDIDSDQNVSTSRRMFSSAVNRLATLSKSIPPLAQQQVRHKSKAMESSIQPLLGFWKPNNLKGLYYGSGTVKENLLKCLPSENSKAFIVTGSSLATKTPLIKQIEELLSSKHAGTFSNIKEHAPVAQLDEASEKVKADSSIDTIISVGGGSPIDSAKAISYRVNEKTGHFLTHIAIPTTLSAAECTMAAGFTKEDGVKTGIAHPNVAPSYILYDSTFALHTPPSLFASTGIRALDHAVELQYHPTATLMPCQWLCLLAIRALFEHLPEYQANPKDEQVILKLYLAAYASLGFLGLNLKGGLGLSHTLGYALGSPYGIPHGITSCMTLGHVVKLKAKAGPKDAAAVAAILPVLPAKYGAQSTGDDVKDAGLVGDAILKLVSDLGFKTTLTDKKVGKDEIDTIVSRATGGLSGKEGMSEEEQRMVSGVKQLVEGLY